MCSTDCYWDWILNLFSSRHFTISELPFRSWIHLALISGRSVKKSIQILYPSCGYPVFLASFIEELCFPNFVFWEPLPKINWQYLCDLVWLLHFVSQSVCVCCELYCSDYDMFVIQLAIRMCDASSFLSLSPHFFFLLALQGCLWF